MGKKSLGEFEQQVLVAILRLGSESYTVPIVLELEERTERAVSPAAVYIALRRLEKRGLVSSRLEAATPEAGNRPRRYFRLEPEALERLQESRRILERLWEGVGPVVEQG
ncbi:MAG: helix-turn-helix transcriptional regulator [Gemmatimonadota bacterium]|nr:MAG: helix-turn-helix transcriptional regulator [Gemmatimonadota bacterium]